MREWLGSNAQLTRRRADRAIVGETAKMLEERGRPAPRLEEFIDRARVRFVGADGQELKVERVLVSWED